MEPGTLAQTWLAAVAVLSPLAMGVGALLPRTRRVSVALAPAAALPALILAMSSRTDWAVSIPWLLLGARIGLDLTGRVFLLLGAITFTLAALAARFDRDVCGASRHRFVAFLLPSAAGTIGMALAQDAVTFYVSFALMSFPAYGLVVFDGRRESLRAGRAYIVFVVAGEVLLVTGLFVIVRTAGTTDFALLPERMAWSRDVMVSVGIILTAFAMKAGVVPLHVWLPPAYTQAPTPASAALAGVMSKAGVLGWLRLLPLGEISLPFWSLLTLAAGLLAAFYGIVVGLTQRNPKTVLAYSSVSQMGFITATIGLGLLVPSAWPVLLVAVLAYVLHHGLAKSALFLGAGLAESAEHPRSKAGVVREYPRFRAGVFGGLALVGLSLAGAPLTSGAVAKTLVKSGFDATAMPSAASVITLMSVAAVGTALLMARFLALVWGTRLDAAPDAGQTGAPDRSPASIAVPAAAPWAIATLVSLLAPWLVMRGLADASAAFTLATAWPVVAGVLIGAAVLGAANRGWHPPVPRIPAGDLLLVAERAAVWLIDVGRVVCARCARSSAASSALVSLDPAEMRVWSAACRLESRLVRWRAFGVLFVGLIFVILVVVLFTYPRVS